MASSEHRILKRRSLHLFFFVALGVVHVKCDALSPDNHHAPAPANRHSFQQRAGGSDLPVV
jgi:hypothetical protein